MRQAVARDDKQQGDERGQIPHVIGIQDGRVPIEHETANRRRRQEKARFANGGSYYSGRKEKDNHGDDGLKEYVR